VDVVGLAQRMEALAESGFHHRKTSGEVVAEGECAVVRSFKAAVKPHAAAAQFPRWMLAAIVAGEGLQMKRTAGEEVIHLDCGDAARRPCGG
jgi:hypothetical protein